MIRAIGATVAALCIAAPAAAQDLDSVIARALANSAELAAAEARTDAARAGIDEARAEHGPQVVAEGQIGVGRIDPQGFFGLTADDVTPRVAKVTVDLPLYTGGRIAAAEAQAQGGAAAAEERVRIVALNTRVRTVDAYSQAIAAQALIARYERLLGALDEILRQARLKFQAGEGTSTEIAQAEARRAEALAGLAATRGRAAQAGATLESLTGGPVAVAAALPELPAVPASPDETTSRAMADNPGVRAARHLAWVAAARVDAVRAERLPTVGAYAEGASVRDQFFPGYVADSGSVGLRARWRFGFGREPAQARGASAELRAANADVLAAERAVAEQSVSAWQDLATARAMLEAAAARVRATDAALSGVRLEARAGAKPQLAVLDAEREAIEAQAEEAAARGRLLTSAYRLRAVAGMDAGSR
jgi:outer membrane protein